MRITVFQDHTDFLERMIAGSQDHHLGFPLSTTVLTALRPAMIVCKLRGELKTLSEIKDLLGTAEAGEVPALERSAAAGVEGEVEGWYCIAKDEGFEWLQQNHAGPVLTWNGAVWWGKLKGIKVDAEVVTHESFSKRSLKPGRRPAKESRRKPAGSVGKGGQGLLRSNVRPIE